jgi:hypothetical protein
MKLPKRIKDILDRKQSFIDSQRDKLSNTTIKLQSKLFNNIISELIPELDVKDGLIQDTPKNYKLISLLDKTYKSFNSVQNGIVVVQIANSTSKIANLNNEYFKNIFSELPKRFEKVLTESKKLIDLKIGLEGDKVFKGGYLDSYFNSSNIGTELKQITSQAVTSNMNMKDYVKILKEKITGTEEYTGSLERQFNMYAYDLYQQYDAAYNVSRWVD